MSKATRYTEEMIEEYSKKGYWGTTTLSDFWDRSAERHPDREAIVDSKTRLTWAGAKQWIDRLALGFMELGIRKDEMIVLQIPPMVEYILIRVACEKAGILCLPVARTFRHSEMEYIFNSVRPAGFVAYQELVGFNNFNMWEEIRPRIPAIPHVFIIGEDTPEGAISLKEILDRPLEQKYPPSTLKERTFRTFETSLIVHTTGTTGMPKFVEHAMCSRLWHGEAYIDWLRLTGNDILGLFAPVSAGPNGPVYFTAPQIGAKVVILEKWDAEEALKLIERERITAGLLVPTMLINLVQHPKFDAYDLSSLRVVWTAGASIPYKNAVEVEERLGCPLLQHYGSLDADISTLNRLDDPREERMRTVGKPIAAVEIKLVDEEGRGVPKGEVGEVWGRGPTSGPGYYGDEKATWEAWEGGWFKMGDLAKWDDKGNLVIAGRKKDMIIRAGQNIYPAEIENMLKSHPKVVDAAIVGMPDPVMGQKCCAYVVIRPEEKFTFDEMIALLKEKRFAPYKLPERLEITDRLPRVGDQQKVDKKILEERITQKLKAEGKT